MAKKGYPGLVLVPPSDRTILRRRLLYVALFIIALVWGASILPVWPPSSDDKATCQPAVGQDPSNSSTENCGQPQSVPLPHRNEFSLTPISQAEALGEPKNSQPVPPPEPDRPVIQEDQQQDSTPPSSGLTTERPDHSLTLPDHEKPAASPPASTPPPSQGIDARLAEQGDAFAQYRLGRYYAQRDGRQAPEAVGWYKKASHGLHRLAETGNGQAMYVLGVMYAYGRGVTRNTEQARRWLTRAVEHKITAAQPVLTSLGGNHTADPNLKTAEQAKNIKQQN